MKYNLIKLTLLLLALAQPCTGLAKKEKTHEVYAFGFGTSFNDSTVYLSAIQRLPDAEIEKKTGFLKHRPSYSQQMKKYLESHFAGHETCVILFATKKEKLEKKYVKIRRQAQRDKTKRVRELPSGEFQFTALNSN